MRKCEICGSVNRIRNSVKFNKNLCPKHYQHFLRVGHAIPITTFDPNNVIVHGDHAELVLRNLKHEEVGKAQISLIDLVSVTKIKWSLRKDGYVGGKIGKKSVLLHRFILNASDGVEIDHLDRVKLNNRRDNLRESDRYQNTANRGTVSAIASSGRVGVTYHARRKKWVAHMLRKGVLVLNKGFDTLEDAINSREMAEKRYGTYA